MLESQRVVARLNATPARRPRRATVTAAVVGAGAWTPGPAASAAAAVVELAPVWHPTPGIRSSAAAIFVVGATVAVIAAAPAVVIAVAAAAAAAAAAPPALRSAAHAYKFCLGGGIGGGRRRCLEPAFPVEATRRYNGVP